MRPTTANSLPAAQMLSPRGIAPTVTPIHVYLRHRHRNLSLLCVKHLMCLDNLSTFNSKNTKYVRGNGLRFLNKRNMVKRADLESSRVLHLHGI